MKSLKTCNFCKSEEGKPRAVGNYIVTLKRIEVMGTRKQACQSCYPKIKRMIEREDQQNQRAMKPTFFRRIHQLGLRISGLFVVMICTTAIVFAQSAPGPPIFPESPSPAPIDGGLGLLAAAGGAYAYKKLKKKNEEDSIR